MKTIGHKVKYCCILLIGLILISAQFVRASEEAFQNNLLKVDVHKTSLGDVKVTLYTAKPYKDAVVVNQKGTNEYVILMPETSNSLTAKPSLKSASDVIQNVEVKTQQYAPGQGQKGYTKIVISSQVPVEISAQTQNLNTQESQINEQEYKELMAHTAKKPSAQVVIPSQKIAPARPTLTKERTVKIAPKAKIAQRNISSPVAKTILTKKQPVKIAQVPVSNVEPTPKATPKEELVQKAESTQVVPEIPKDQTTAQEPTQGVEQQPLSQQAVAPTATVPIQPPTAPQSDIQKYKHLIKTHINEILIGLSVPIILILLLMRGARKSVKKMQEQKEHFETNLAETPAPVRNYSDKISDDMSWREKYQTFVEASNAPPEKQAPPAPQQPAYSPQAQNVENNEDLEALFNGDLFASDVDENDLSELDAEPTSGAYEEPVASIPIEPYIKPEEEINRNVQQAFMSAEDFLSENAQETAQEVENEDLVQGLDGLEDLIFENSFNAQEEVSIEDLFKEEFKQEAPKVEPKAILPVPEPIKEEFVEPKKEEYVAPIIEKKAEEQPKPVSESTFMSNPMQGEVKKEEGELVQAKVEIDSQRGFCLVEFEGSTALVGYIGEEIFIIKRFDELVSGKLQARISEFKGAATDYIVKVGKFKAMVEVGSKSMNCLIEL